MRTLGLYLGSKQHGRPENCCWGARWGSGSQFCGTEIFHCGVCVNSWWRSASELAWILGRPVGIQRIRQPLVGFRKHLGHIYLLHTYMYIYLPYGYITIYTCITLCTYILPAFVFYIDTCITRSIYITIILRTLRVYKIHLNRMVSGGDARSHKSGGIEKSALTERTRTRTSIN